MYDNAIDSRLHEIGVRTAFAYRTKSIENDELREALQESSDFNGHCSKDVDQKSLEVKSSKNTWSGSILSNLVRACLLTGILTEELHVN
jgi:hypothetical protein